MATLQSRLSDLITAIGADIKNFYQAGSGTTTPTPGPPGSSRRNQFFQSAVATNATFGAPTGTPVEGNTLVIRIKDNGTARTLSWNAIYRSIDTINTPLPISTVAGKWMFIGFIYNAIDSTWDLVSVLKQT